MRTETLSWGLLARSQASAQLPGAASVCHHPLLGHLWTRSILIFGGDKGHKENGIFHFRRMLEGSSVHSSEGSQPGPAHKEQSRDPGSRNARWPWRRMLLGRGAGGIMDSHKERRSNWQLSGLKGSFWAAVKGFRCETLVFKSPEQNVWLLSAAPLVLPKEGGVVVCAEEEGGEQGHSRAICYSTSEWRALSPPPGPPPPVLVRLVRGADWDGTNSSPHNGRSRERQGK